MFINNIKLTPTDIVLIQSMTTNRIHDLFGQMVKLDPNGEAYKALQNELHNLEFLRMKLAKK